MWIPCVENPHNFMDDEWSHAIAGIDNPITVVIGYETVKVFTVVGHNNLHFICRNSYTALKKNPISSTWCRAFSKGTKRTSSLY